MAIGYELVVSYVLSLSNEKIRISVLKIAEQQLWAIVKLSFYY